LTCRRPFFFFFPRCSPIEPAESKRPPVSWTGQLSWADEALFLRFLPFRSYAPFEHSPAVGIGPLPSSRISRSGSRSLVRVSGTFRLSLRSRWLENTRFPRLVSPLWGLFFLTPFLLSFFSYYVVFVEECLMISLCFVSFPLAPFFLSTDALTRGPFNHSVFNLERKNGRGLEPAFFLLPPPPFLSSVKIIIAECRVPYRIFPFLDRPTRLKVKEDFREFVSRSIFSFSSPCSSRDFSGRGVAVFFFPPLFS